MDKKITCKNNLEAIVFDYIANKKSGTYDVEVTREDMLLEHMNSVDFMEMIVHIENQFRISCDMSNTDLEMIMKVGGFIDWVTQLANN